MLKSFTKKVTVHLTSFTLAMLATIKAIISFSMLGQVMALDPRDNTAAAPPLNQKLRIRATIQFRATEYRLFFRAYEKEHFKYCGKSIRCVLDFYSVGVNAIKRLQRVTGP